MRFKLIDLLDYLKGPLIQLNQFFAPPTMNYWALLNLLVIAVSVGDVLSEKRIRNDCGRFYLLSGETNCFKGSKKACGEANIVNRGRIVNGKATTPNKWPWMAAMFGSKGNFQCGGSVISDKTIVTAAHCVF